MKGIITNCIHLSLNIYIYVYECKCAYNNACTFMHLCKRSLKHYMDMLVYKWKRGKTVEVNITPSDPQRLPDDLTEIALRKNRRSAQRRRRTRRKRPGRMINSRAPFMATLRAAQPQQRPTKADPSPSLPPHPQKQPLTRGNPSFLLLLHFSSSSRLLLWLLSLSASSRAVGVSFFEVRGLQVRSSITQVVS